jgi:hypothetical protein
LGTGQVEVGLEQDFNSLHPQREAVEAFFERPKRLGWILVRRHYDDGGFNGGNLDRPALQRLREPVDAGAAPLCSRCTGYCLFTITSRTFGATGFTP